MKRKLILLVVTIVFLVGFGVILHSPPSMIDAVTGATPKSKKAAQASAQLEGSYVLGINMMSDGLDNENTRNKLKELALDDSETNETDLMKTDISFRLYVCSPLSPTRTKVLIVRCSVFIWTHAGLTIMRQ